MKSAIFIDGANVSATVKKLGYQIDYKRLRQAYDVDGMLIRAFYYTATLTIDDVDNLRPLTDWLDYHGYSVVTKECKTFTDELTGVMKVKGNMDMEIAVDCMRMAEHVDNIILFSGDGDFTYVVKAVQQKGCMVTVVSSLHARMIADELRRAADIFIDLHDPRIRKAIERRHADAESR